MVTGPEWKKNWKSAVVPEKIAMETQPPSEDPNPLRPLMVPRLIILIVGFALLAFLGLIAWRVFATSSLALQIGEPAPAFTLTSFDGRVFDTSELKGKVIVLNFWASWCIPCEEESPILESAWQAYQSGGKVLFLGVDYVDTEGPAADFLERNQITYPNGPDLRSEISHLYNITGVPETYIIGPNGRLAYFKIGPIESVDEIRKIVDNLLK